MIRILTSARKFIEKHVSSRPASNPYLTALSSRQIPAVLRTIKASGGPRSSRLTARLGEVDHVTLLPNRLQFLREIPAPSGQSDARCALILVTLADARHFNEILRALGHSFADDFVRMGAGALAYYLLPDVILYHVSVLSFAFVVPTSNGLPRPLLERLVEIFREPLICGDIPISTRVGIGVVQANLKQTSPGELLRAALAAAQDSRMKSAGWSEYDHRSDEAHQRGFQLLTDLHEAINSGWGLSLTYQPRTDLSSGNCCGFEAIPRWQHPTRGDISPSEFIPLADATAIVIPLTKLALDQAIAFMQRWPGSWSGLRMSVKIPANALQDQGFSYMLLSLLDRYGVKPECLELGIIASTMTSRDAGIIEQINRIQALGVGFAIDDFGAGSSNFQSLTDLPAQSVKIDQSFIRPLDTDPRRALLAHKMIDLAHELGYVVVADCVQTAESLETLRNWGCDQAQGPFIAPALPEDSITEWMAARLPL